MRAYCQSMLAHLFIYLLFLCFFHSFILLTLLSFFFLCSLHFCVCRHQNTARALTGTLNHFPLPTLVVSCEKGLLNHPVLSDDTESGPGIVH